MKDVRKLVHKEFKHLLHQGELQEDILTMIDFTIQECERAWQKEKQNLGQQIIHYRNEVERLKKEKQELLKLNKEAQELLGEKNDKVLEWKVRYAKKEEEKQDLIKKIEEDPDLNYWVDGDNFINKYMLINLIEGGEA